jgi:hypothetical protein
MLTLQYRFSNHRNVAVWLMKDLNFMADYLIYTKSLEGLWRKTRILNGKRKPTHIHYLDEELELALKQQKKLKVLLLSYLWFKWPQSKKFLHLKFE